MKIITILRICLLAIFTVTAANVQGQGASGDIDPPRAAEEMLVTGSYIKGLTQENLASPLTTFDRDELRNVGATRIADLVNSLTINTGSENNTDAFTQNLTTGTSNINLRGLGVASTLVLLNSRRQTYSAFTTDKGENFVDTASLVPLIAVERVEILKDGAASVYGSDAVAGVANFHTRNNFEGFEVEIESLSGESDEMTLSAIFGVGGADSHFMLAASFQDRDPLTTADRNLSLPGDSVSQAGMPGSFLIPFEPTFPGAQFNTLVAPGVTIRDALQGGWNQTFNSLSNFTVPGVPFQLADFFEPLVGNVVNVPAGKSPPLQPVLADFACTPLAQNDSTILPPPAANDPFGPCQYDFSTFFSLVPEEERSQVFSTCSHDFSDSLSFYSEIAYAKTEASRFNSPSFPISSTPVVCGPFGLLDSLLNSACANQITIPGLGTIGPVGAHPDNPYGTDVLFIGRTIGGNSNAALTLHDSETTRVVAELSGSLGDSWDWSVDLTQSKNEFSLRAKDTLAREFQFALWGLGGANCNPITGSPGVGDCQYFNPFGSSLTDASLAGSGNSNAQILDFVTGTITIDAEAELTTVGALASRKLFDLSGGEASIALGAQIRDEKLSYDYDDQSNADNYIFFIGNPDFDVDRSIKAVFTELALPLSKSLDLQLSLRYEDYDDAGDSTDPKIAALWRASDNLSLRGSFSTSFRAPSLYQQNGVQTTLKETKTPALGEQFISVRARPNPADPLKPEAADVLNLGGSWVSDSEAFVLSADYWSYDYDNVIIQENHQAILDQAEAAFPPTGCASAQVVCTGAGTLQQINVFYDNASTLETDGIDLSTSYEWLLNEQHVRLGLVLSKVMTYDLVDPQSGPIDGLGRRNFENFATSVPELRANLNLHWSTAKHAVNVYWRHIDSYINDELNDSDIPLNEEIEAHTTIDLQYRYQLDPIGNTPGGIELAVGAINLTDEDPPHVTTPGGFDSKVHDPRGQIVYLRAAIPF